MGIKVGGKSHSGRCQQSLFLGIPDLPRRDGDPHRHPSLSVGRLPSVTREAQVVTPPTPQAL